MWHHDDVIKWKLFPRYWPFVRGIDRSPVNSPHKGQWRKALMFSLICARIYGWVNNGEAGDLRRHRGHYDVTVIFMQSTGNAIFRVPRYFIAWSLVCIALRGWYKLHCVISRYDVTYWLWSNMLVPCRCMNYWWQHSPVTSKHFQAKSRYLS